MSPEEWLSSQTKPATPVLSPEEWESQNKLGTVPSVVESEKTNPQYQFDPRVSQVGALTGLS